MTQPQVQENERDGFGLTDWATWALGLVAGGTPRMARRHIEVALEENYRLVAERDRYREVIATLRDYLTAPEGDGPIRYTQALDLCREALDG